MKNLRIKKVASLKNLYLSYIGIILSVIYAPQISAEVFDLPAPGNDVIGAIAVVKSRAEETLLDIARRHGLGYEGISRANKDVDNWLPGEGTNITLPSRYILPSGPREGIVLNLAEYRMYYYPEVSEDDQRR